MVSLKKILVSHLTIALGKRYYYFPLPHLFQSRVGGLSTAEAAARIVRFSITRLSDQESNRCCQQIITRKMSDRSEHINEYDPIDDNNSVALDADDEEIENRTHSTNISQLTHSKVVNDGLESVHDSFARTQSDWADRKICKRRVVDFSSGEEDHIPSHQRLTHKGGYAHTKTSRLKISQANSGNIPWNKGKNRTSGAKAKISAGVRARNHAVLLKKLEKLDMTEEEWMSSKRKIKLLRERVRKARFAVEKEGQLRELRRLERRKSDQKERALRKLLAKQEESEDDDVPNFPDSESDVDSDKELMSQPAFDDEEMISTAEIIDDTLESEDKSMAEDKLQSNNEVSVLRESSLNAIHASHPIAILHF